MTKKALCFIIVALMIGVFTFSLITAAAPSDTETLFIPLDAEPTGLDPAKVADGPSANVITNIMEGLVGFKSGTNEVIPVLAESWEVKENATVFIFNLRKNVKFHDGTEFNAEAAKFNMERQLAENKTEDMPYADTIYGDVNGVEIIDDYTIKVTLNNPNVTFLNQLASIPGGPFVSPTALEQDPDGFMKNPVGTGPYKFVEWVPDQYLVVEKFDDYWGEESKVEEVVYKIIKDSAVRTSELISGSIDILPSVDINHIERLKSADVNVGSLPGATLSYIALYTDKEPFNNKKVRQAVFMGIDRESIVKGLYGEHGITAKGIIPPTFIGYSEELQPLPYDPEKAKKLLKEAGYEDGLSFKLVAYNVAKNYNPAGERLALALQNELKKIDVEVEVDVKPWNEFATDLFSEEPEGHAVQIGWGVTSGDPSGFMTLLKSKNTGTGLNFAEYENEKIDELAAKAISVADSEQRAEYYKQIQEIIIEDVPWIFMSHSVDYYATRTNIEGFTGGNNCLKTNHIIKN